ncbi:hypothetical protein ACPF8X_17630 [Streptomyces sp. G35A]
MVERDGVPEVQATVHAPHDRAGPLHPRAGRWRSEPERTQQTDWNVTAREPRDIWKELQDLAALWRAAGSPDRYRLLFEPDGGQRAASRCGRLSWRLAAPPPSGEGATS